MVSVQEVLAYTYRNFTRSVKELGEFIRFESIGTDAKYKAATAACANWLARHLQQIGLHHVQVFQTPKHPLVYAEWLHQPGKPTLLIYGHYDVQPVEPIRHWSFPPFRPFVQGNYIHGRGASDDKGQLFAHLKAVEAFLKTYQKLPINVKCLFDGEEEIGSPSLESFIQTHRDMLKADVAVLSDMAMLSAEQPTLAYALRGSLSVELEVESQGVDLHSGNFGGAVHNPLQVVCELIAKLHDRNGRIAIPGFYDQVKQYSPAERKYMRRFGPTDQQIMQSAKANHQWGEQGYSAYERTTIRPALSINGIVGGYQEPGVKSVIPSKATAKLNFRLVPHQSPKVVEQQLRQYIKEIAPPTVSVRIRASLHAGPYELSTAHPALEAGKQAYTKGFGKKPVLTRVGGTVPVVSLFKDILHVSTVLMGFGLPTDRIHAPNERFYLPNFLKGIHTCTWFMTALGKRKSASGVPASRRVQKKALKAI